MKKDSDTTQPARDSMIRTLLLEAQTIRAASERLTQQCDAIVDLLAGCRGRVLMTGMGKTGYVARKAASTFSSTGAPAIFLHPSEAIHGDLGIVTNQDVLIAISNSGETEEILKLIEFMQRTGVPVISLTGNLNSTLACHSDFVLDCGVEKEADELSLVPTCSTTLMLAMSDALAMVLMDRRGFTAEQFAQFHPGGALGKKLLLRVEDVMHTGDAVPIADQTTSLRTAMEQISQFKFGCLFLLDRAVNEKGALVGVLTDGDLRRTFQKFDGNIDALMDTRVSDIMTREPLTTTSRNLAAEGLHVMEERQVTVLPVVDDGVLVGVVHLHDIIKAGLA